MPEALQVRGIDQASCRTRRRVRAARLAGEQRIENPMGSHKAPLFRRKRANAANNGVDAKFITPLGPP